MAFTDLEEHLEEVFGEPGVYGTEELSLGFAFVLRRAAPASRQASERAPPLPRERRTYRTPAQRKRDTLHGIKWRSARRKAAQFRALEAGERPWRCQRPGCCNLLPVSTHGGPPPLYCRRTCRMATYDREARRTPEAKARKNERRRVKHAAV